MPEVGLVDDGVLAARHFDASAANIARVRRLVTETVESSSSVAPIEDVVLGATELATNALLHTRQPFEVILRRVGAGVRVEVIDPRPDQLPSLVPASGTASDITAVGSTGRGLLIVAAMASRWGYTTSDSRKAVWAEFGTLPITEEPSPVVLLAKTADTDGPRFELLDMPVRAAIASGVQVDELVRDLHLTGVDEPDGMEELWHLLDVSAPARLAGRYAALHAAACDEVRFDLRVRIPLDAIVALGALNELLDEMATRRGLTFQMAEGVRVFRERLVAEIGRQLNGEPPTPFPSGDATTV
jgi:hypothetical protein